MDRSIIYFVLGLSLFAVCQADLKSHIPICKAADPKLEECLISSGHQLIKYLVPGSEEFKIPAVDPMYVPKLALRPVGSTNSPVRLELVLLNSTHYGLADTKIQKASAKPQDYEFEFTAFIPNYTIVGKYAANGKIMLLPMNGKGDSLITLYDVTSVWKLKGESEDRSGVKYYKLKKFDVSITPKNMKTHFDNLFQGNKALEDTMNGLLNQNWQEIYKQLRHSLEEKYSELCFEIADKIFSVTPLNQIFSDM